MFMQSDRISSLEEHPKTPTRKKDYITPKLVGYGSVAELTRGSGGTDPDGSSGTKKPKKTLGGPNNNSPLKTR